jgi:adenosylcobinamide-GDP ribazoletransferase
MRLIDDIRICLIFFTRVPVTWKEDLPRERITRAFRAAPAVGILSGVAAALAYLLGFELTGGSVHVGATLAVITQLVLTGAFHEDGFADLFDGFGVRGADAKLEVMRDSRLGTFGAAALFSAILLKVFLIAEIAFPWQTAMALIAAGALSRGALVQVMATVKPATGEGMAAEAGQPTPFEATFALAFAAGAAGLALFLGAGLGAVLTMAGAAAGAAAAAAGVALLARRYLGGQTGDVLGAAAIAAELGALLGIVALLPTPGL